MSQFSRRIKKGSTDVAVVLRMLNAISSVPQVSMAEDASGIWLRYWRQGGGNWVSFAPAAVSFLSSAHTDGGFEPIADGFYRVDLPDAACASGADGVLVSGGATGVYSDGFFIELTDYNPQTVTAQTTPEKY